ncbi:hypothetical protein QL285_061858 [Trifolium repens]|nr:hypothetical protein QL285_061858 [Trifolium repens]
MKLDNNKKRSINLRRNTSITRGQRSFEQNNQVHSRKKSKPEQCDDRNPTNSNEDKSNSRNTKFGQAFIVTGKFKGENP